MTERFPLRSEIDSAPAQTERPANTRGKSFISRSSITSVIKSFIEAKRKEICCREIETLKSEASTSYASEKIISLQNENDMLQQKLKELENRYESARVEQEFSPADEDKSLLTAIRLLNNEFQNSRKEMNGMSINNTKNANCDSGTKSHNQQS